MAQNSYTKRTFTMGFVLEKVFYMHRQLGDCLPVIIFMCMCGADVRDNGPYAAQFERINKTRYVIKIHVNASPRYIFFTKMGYNLFNFPFIAVWELILP